MLICVYVCVSNVDMCLCLCVSVCVLSVRARFPYTRACFLRVCVSVWGGGGVRACACALMCAFVGVPVCMLLLYARVCAFFFVCIHTHKSHFCCAHL
jgi:hypothetical protein